MISWKPNSVVTYWWWRAEIREFKADFHFESLFFIIMIFKKN